MRRGLPTRVALAAFVCVVVGPASLAGGASPAAAAPIPQRPAPPVLDDLRGPLAREAAAFAAGRVAVAVVFVESDGSVDPSTENWSRPDPDYPGDRRANVLAKMPVAPGGTSVRPTGRSRSFSPRRVSTARRALSRRATSLSRGRSASSTRTTGEPTGFVKDLPVGP